MKNMSKKMVSLIVSLGIIVVLCTAIGVYTYTYNRDLESLNVQGESLKKINENIPIIKEKEKTIISNIETKNAELETITSNVNDKNAELDTINSDINDKNSELDTINSNIKTAKDDLDSIIKSNSSGEIPAGEYTGGEDIEEGTYTVNYKTDLGDDSYWSSDYLYITRDGSEGSDETLGGTTFDSRFGGFIYEKASAGVNNHLTINNGDKLLVESDYGNWTY